MDKNQFVIYILRIMKIIILVLIITLYNSCINNEETSFSETKYKGIWQSENNYLILMIEANGVVKTMDCVDNTYKQSGIGQIKDSTFFLSGSEIPYLLKLDNNKLIVKYNQGFTYFSSINNIPSSCKSKLSGKYFLPMPTNGVFYDSINDMTDYDFINLEKVEFIITSDSIKIIYNLKNIPDQLIYNDSSLGSGVVEYSWSTNFDIDNDGELSKGDLNLAFKHSKVEPSNQLDSLKNFGSFMVSRYSSISTTGISSIGLNLNTYPNIIITNKQIIINVSKTASPELTAISMNSNIFTSTQYINNQVNIIDNLVDY